MIKLCIVCCITTLITTGICANVEFTVPSVDDSAKNNGEPLGEIPKPELYSMRVYSEVNTRYAKNVVSSRVVNPANQSQEVTFAIVIPETAFISEFLMELDGKVYKAYVKKKEEAKQIYNEAVASGIGAAHVSMSARDSNRFTVSVNVEAMSKAVFNLTYEELLTRRLGVYNLVINLHPGQLVREMTVDVDITESQKITVLRIPALRTGNEIDPDENTENNAFATKKFTNDAKTKAHIKFSPTMEQQQELINQLKHKQNEKTDDPNSGISGQFVIQYDVERDLSGGSVVVYDGYFVHFFAPNGLTPLNKHVIFVLDVSGSMMGSKIAQLKSAMNYILDDLRPGDYFNLIEFSYDAHIYDLNNITNRKDYKYNWFSDERENPEEVKLIPAFVANADSIAKAKKVIDQLDAFGGTNIDAALKVALKVAEAGVRKADGSSGPDPLIIFLTDGDPTVGETRTTKILSRVSELNTGARYSSIFALAFGNDADRGFLKQLAVRNSGFMRHIYEANDADVQLQQFYKQISSPLLKNISFVYPENQVEDLTDHHCNIMFSGSEFIIAGKLIDKDVILKPTIRLPGPNQTEFIPKIVQNSVTSQSKPSLERLWAFLKIKQLLDQKDAYIDTESGPTLSVGTTTEIPDTKSIEDQAVEIALKYSFVTKLTSLVVVKPNSSSDTTAETIPVPSPVESDRPIMALALNVQNFAQSSSASSAFPSSSNYFYQRKIISGPSPQSVYSMSFPTSNYLYHRSAPRVFYNAPVRTVPIAYDYVYDIDRKDDWFDSSTINLSTTPVPNNVWLLHKYNLDNMHWLYIFDGFVEINNITYNITDLPENKSSFGECNNAINGTTGVCVPVNKCTDSGVLLTSEIKYEEYKCNGEYSGILYFTICCSNSSIQTTESNLKRI